ncbi:hypothetical protein QKG08_14980 [Clavibacter michiganensis]|uniref:hypothetical protein n=1 Tax=Clavibacter michiganensis TaxID=28447 RepID=UPI0026DC48F1|nr:hypothetical protein [Clavibacter michiganensis]MDO4070356.1 hypothetical protein [Clavibacter michiganensis]
MAIELATIEYNRDAQEWRLYSPGREQMLSLPDGFRSVIEVEEREFINAVLRTWGFRPAADMATWSQAEGGAWVLAVQEHATL